MTEPGNSPKPIAQQETPSKQGLIAGLRGDLLSVMSAVGTALTVISTLEDTLTVAAWARAVADGFQSAASHFWTVTLPWLPIAPRPMDVVFLNMSAFCALIAIASLSPRAEVPVSWREKQWRSELLAALGTGLAIGVLSWAGFSSIQEHLSGPAFTQYMTAIEAARTVEEGEVASLTYLTEISAFVPAADWFAQAVGLASGPLVERLHTVMYVLLLLHIAIILTPMYLVLGVGSAFGARWNSRKTARWAWLFLALVASVVLLGRISEAWAGMCADDTDSMLKLLCGIVN